MSLGNTSSVVESLGLDGQLTNEYCYAVYSRGREFVKLIASTFLGGQLPYIIWSVTWCCSM